MRIIQSDEINTKEKFLVALPLISFDELDIEILEGAIYNYLKKY